MVYVLDLAAQGIGEGGDRIVSASRSSGSKLPRHRFFSSHRFFPATGSSLPPEFFLVPRFFLTTGSSSPWGWLWGAASRPSGDKSPHHKSG